MDPAAVAAYNRVCGFRLSDHVPPTSYLHREETTTGDEAPRDRPALPEGPSAVWRVPADMGRRYAAVSGDRNPIHMSALTARLSGFGRALAHGMWSKARCLAALEPHVGRPSADHPIEIRVAFAKPLLLPATVAFAAAVADDITFALRSAPGPQAPARLGDGGTLHLHGRISQ